MSANQMPTYRSLASIFHPTSRVLPTIALLVAGGLFLPPRLLHAQTVSYSGTAVNFGTVNICPAGQTTPAPCSATMTLTFTVTASGTLGTPKALTLGAPDQDFTVASGSTCTGSVTEGNTCTVNVTFAPRFAGLRRGGVEVVDGSGNVLADVPVYGTGNGPQATFQPGTLSTVPGSTTFTGPRGLALDGSGNLFVGDWDNSVVYEILATGGIKTLDFGFGLQLGVAVDGSGNVFAAAYNCPPCGSFGGSGVVYEIFAAGGYTTAKTLAVYPDVNWPWGVAVDGSGNVFVADAYDNAVKEIPAAGGYTTIKTLTSGGPLGTTGVAVDGGGNVFVTEGGFNNNAVKEILAAGGYTTIKNLGSGFGYPVGVAVDAADDVFVADYGDGAVKEILAAGGYTTVNTLATGLSAPQGIAMDGSGNVFVGLTPSGGIDEFHYADPPSVVFPAPTVVGATDTVDGPQTVSVWNSGNQPLLFSTPGTGSNPDYLSEDFPENSTDAHLCAAGLSLASGTSCDVSMGFVPSAVGVNTGSVALADNTLNQAGATQTIAVSGTGISSPISTAITLTSSAKPSTLGEGVTFTATVTPASGPAPTGTVSFYDASGTNLLAIGMLSGGAATYTTSSLPVGTYHLVAKYSGSSADAARVSAVLVQTVLYGTTTTLTSSANPSTAGGAVTFTATVIPSGGAAPTGTVSFYDAYGATLLATAALTDGVANGVATYTTSSLPAGTYHIVAKYSGSGADAVSESALLVQGVNP